MAYHKWLSWSIHYWKRDLPNMDIVKFLNPGHMEAHIQPNPIYHFSWWFWNEVCWKTTYRVFVSNTQTIFYHWCSLGRKIILWYYIGVRLPTQNIRQCIVMIHKKTITKIHPALSKQKQDSPYPVMAKKDGTEAQPHYPTIIPPK